MNRRKLNRAWDTLRTLPMPAIATDRMIDLHDDLAHYDMVVATAMREFVRGNPLAGARLALDEELEESLRSFKPKSSAEIEGRREMLRYKRRIDDVVRELSRLKQHDLQERHVVRDA
jgi:hypothetical protein